MRNVSTSQGECPPISFLMAESYDEVLVFANLNQHVCGLPKRAFYFSYISHYKYIHFLKQSSTTASLCWALKDMDLHVHPLIISYNAGHSQVGLPRCGYSVSLFIRTEYPKLNEGPDCHSFVDNTSF